MNEMLKQQRMTVDEFIPWAMAQPRGRYELIDGEVVMMGPERLIHVRACEAMGDGVTVRIDERTAYEPDALVY